MSVDERKGAELQTPEDKNIAHTAVETVGLVATLCMGRVTTT